MGTAMGGRWLDFPCICQRQAEQSGFSYTLSLSFGFFYLKVREMDQIRFFPVLKADSGLFSINVCSNRSLVEDYRMQMTQVSERVPTSVALSLLVAPHDFLRISLTTIMQNM